jgi:hypothetical protein
MLLLCRRYFCVFCLFFWLLVHYFPSVLRTGKEQKKTSWLNEALKVLSPNDLRPTLVIYMVNGDFEMR